MLKETQPRIQIEGFLCFYFYYENVVLLATLLNFGTPGTSVYSCLTNQIAAFVHDIIHHTVMEISQDS